MQVVRQCLLQNISVTLRCERTECASLEGRRSGPCILRGSAAVAASHLRMTELEWNDVAHGACRAFAHPTRSLEFRLRPRGPWGFGKNRWRRLPTWRER